MLVDGRAAWLGGRNFTARSFFGQHDLSFTLRGPLTGELAEMFEKAWQEQGGTPQAACGLADSEPPRAANAWANGTRQVLSETESSARRMGTRSVMGGPIVL